MKFRGIEFDLRDVFAGAITIAVILYLYTARLFVATTFRETVAEERRIRDQHLDAIERKIDALVPHPAPPPIAPP